MHDRYIKPTLERLLQAEHLHSHQNNIIVLLLTDLLGGLKSLDSNFPTHRSAFQSLVIALELVLVYRKKGRGTV